MHRFGVSPAAVPPQHRPDPRKCKGDREVVRELFQELNDRRRKSLAMVKIPDSESTKEEVSEFGSSERELRSEADEHAEYDQVLRYDMDGGGVVRVEGGEGFVHVDRGPPTTSDGVTECVTERVTDRISDPNDVADSAQYHRYHRGSEEVSAAGITEQEGNEQEDTEHGYYEEQTKHGYYEEHGDQPSEETADETATETEVATESGYYQDTEGGHTRTSVASSENNSFDQVAKDLAKDLEVFDPVNDQELTDVVGHIPERNQDRLLSEQVSEIQGADDEDQAVTEVEDHYEEHHELQEEPTVQGYEHEEHVEEVEEFDNQDQGTEHDIQQRELGEEEADAQLQVDENDGDDERTQRGSEHPPGPGGPDDDSTLGPPPSFIFRTERLSRNVADAMANIWDRFWAEDVREIIRIIKNRFSQLMPYIRRFLAHIVAFWGGINYIRRALTAFIRILNRDERVRELLERIGWASTTTVRVFLSICAMIMQAALQMYYLLRDRIIPDTRRVIPILYYKAVMKVLQTAERSPWSLLFGPFSFTFAIDANKVPDPYWLHNKLSVPRDDVTFGPTQVQSFVQSIKETLNRSRDKYGSQVSTPVHSQTTDEMPFPPPVSYSVSRAGENADQHHRFRHKHHGKHSQRSRGEPLTERTNNGGHWQE